MKLALRDYQKDAVNTLRSNFGSGIKSLLYVLPTGGGKTFGFSYIASKALLKENKVLILVHRQELVDQTADSLKAMGLEFGIIAARYPMDLNKGIQICSVQTLVRRLNKIKENSFNLLIIDEAHHATAGSWKKIIDHNSKAKLLGVTATPERLDGRPLKDKFQKIIQGPQVDDLQEKGFLSPFRVFVPPSEINVSIMRKRMGDYHQADVEEQVQKKTFIGDAVKHYLKFLDGKTAIAFCSSIKHSKMVAAEFNANGIVAEALDGNTPSHLRKAILTDLGNGIIKVVTSCQIINEGTDIPSVSGCILLRPTMSLSVYLQQVGRCLRPQENKTAIILDHVGNVKRHGLPNQKRDWSLDGRQKRASKKDDSFSVKVCPICFTAVLSVSKSCECGHVFDPQTEAEHITIDAELVELKKEEIRYKKEKRREVGRARTLEQLEAVATERGYKKGWAYHIYTQRKNRPTNYGFNQ